MVKEIALTRSIKLRRFNSLDQILERNIQDSNYNDKNTLCLSFYIKKKNYNKCVLKRRHQSYRESNLVLKLKNKQPNYKLGIRQLSNY